MDAKELMSVGTEVYKCLVSKIKFWEFNGKIWATFHNSRWDFMKDSAVCWGSSSKLENIIDYQVSVYKNR